MGFEHEFDLEKGTLFGISEDNRIQIVWSDSEKFSGSLGVVQVVASAGISGGIHKTVSLVHTVALRGMPRPLCY